MRTITTHAGVTLSCANTAAEPLRLHLEQDGQSIEIPLNTYACSRLMAELQIRLHTDRSYILPETDGRYTAILDGAPLFTGSRAAVRKHIRERIRDLPSQAMSDYMKHDLFRKLSRLEAEL